MKSKIEIIPYLFYRDVAAALDWLSRAFGFVEEMRMGTPRGGIHGEMSLGGCRVMMGQGVDASGPAVDETAHPTQGIFVYLDNVDTHFQRAAAAGARIEKPLEDLPYGRSYTARDLEGHVWYFTQPA
jgi:PhnB protein